MIDDCDCEGTRAFHPIARHKKGPPPDSDPCPVCRANHWPWHAHALRDPDKPHIPQPSDICSDCGLSGDVLAALDRHDAHRASADGRWDHAPADLSTHCDGCLAQGRASAEGLRARIAALPYLDVNTEDGGGGRMVALDAVLAALRDTGPRPDSGIDVEALVAKLQAAPYHWNERIVHDLREVLSTPRTETSDTVRIGSKTYLAGADDD